MLAFLLQTLLIKTLLLTLLLLMLLHESLLLLFLSFKKQLLLLLSLLVLLRLPKKFLDLLLLQFLSISNFLKCLVRHKSWGGLFGAAQILQGLTLQDLVKALWNLCLADLVF